MNHKIAWCRIVPKPCLAATRAGLPKRGDMVPDWMIPQRLDSGKSEAADEAVIEMPMPMSDGVKSQFKYEPPEKEIIGRTDNNIAGFNRHEPCLNVRLLKVGDPTFQPVTFF